MPPSTVITDRELQQRSQCSIYVPAEVDLLEEPARLTIRWALRERHQGKICSVVDLRKRWVTEWEKSWGKGAKSAGYWKGVQKSSTFGRRVYEFLLKYEVRHPYEPYTLQFGGSPMLVDPLLRRPRYVKTPNYTVLAQWLAARQDVDAVELGIAHLPLLSGEPWLTKDVNEPLARQWLNQLVSEAANKNDFPHIGLQCTSCSHPCN